MYQKVYEKIYFPFFERFLKHRRIASIYEGSFETQWLNLSKIQNRQVNSLKKLLCLAQTHSAYYKDLFKRNSFDPHELSSLNDLSQIDILNKDIIRQKFDSLISSPFKNNLWRKSTGGSTGQPLHFGYTKESYEWRVAMSKRGYAWAGARPGTKQAYIWGVSLGETTTKQRLKESLHHFIDRQKFYNCFEFGEQEMAQCLASLNKWQPQNLVGYTNPLYEFALYVDRNGGPLFKPQSILCAAEKVYPYQREVLQKVFGAPVFNTYGSREFMLIASECEKHEGLHISMENLIVEVVDDDGRPTRPGEVGKILVTDLHNYGMPFIRYEIGDMARVSDHQCSCGRGLMLLDDIVGRSLDVIRLPEGKTLPGEFFPHLMKDFPEVYRFQVIQDRIDQLIVKLVPHGELGAGTRSAIEQIIASAVGPDMVVAYEIVSEIPLTISGKHRVTISNLSQVVA
ncbi:hypothetical protein A7E78_00335 [Syntrophotalea acetylenivorans]|uniref:Uncharacterized protein n=1 Tax=Syntrophotalea acetylenivorans TaxID=1842532 RepID=A0A1L3GKH1_9BACT|nr:phenylacetate--CoA ligase family protein [Syntrophotalea acetylenivorans]APG26447.1 hypothetical protein A7E78_00335 [Syntrophotalea acetylenivorans]